MVFLYQYNFYKINGRLRGVQEVTGPFERGTNPFERSIDSSSSNNSTYFLDSGDNFNFFKDLLAPVDHSIPLNTLINVHFILILGLFLLILSLIFLFIYFCINLLILFNKDYFLNTVKNKYILMYVKYVVFKTRVDIIVIGIFIFSLLCFIAYVLHYLIVHPIII